MKHVLYAIFISSFFQIFFWNIDSSNIIKPPSTDTLVMSVSYSPYTGFERRNATDKEIENDIEIMSKYTKKIRTYAIDDANKVLPIVQEKSMLVDVGIWISGNKEENQKEIAKAVELVNKYPWSISSVIVGNEVVLRNELKPAELVEYINEVKEKIKKPVTTAETWYIWIQNPQLAQAVDFINVHMLPYWEFVHIDNFLAFAKERYADIQKAFPEKSIVIGEFGWPSQGYNNKGAEATLENQAFAIRQFLILAKESQWEYNIVEAFDQPWKGKDEGSVGPYWGIYGADREPKFFLSGEVILNPLKDNQMMAAIIIGALFSFFGLRNQRINFWHALTYSIASQGMALGVVMAATYPFVTYMNFGMWVMWSMGALLMVPLAVITLAKVNELFKCTIGHPPERLVRLNLKTDRVPFVSIHVPAYKEQPHVLIETIKALSELKYTNYEVLIIVNNTPDEFYKKEVREYCEQLGEKFKFLDIVCTGFKAGALNEAMKYTNPEAEIIALIDADYTVKPNWLIDLVPLFDDPKVALVQAPQDHRDGDESLIKTAMNAEYAGFFDIGMVERNEENAIVVHGTMLLIRYSAMQEVGGWSTDTIVEDSELGLRLFEAGYSAHYTNRRYGYGLLPDTIEAFKNQRHRWAYGAIQILKKHWRHFKPSSKTLTPEQKHHFVTGWFFWLSDAFGAVMSILNIIWVPVIIFVGVTIPTIPLTVPILTAFLVNILHAFILYHTRVKINFNKSLLSAIAAMSLQLIIFKAVFDGFVKDGLPFKRTEKGGNTSKAKTKNPIKYETYLAVLLLGSFFALIFTNKSAILEVYVFACTLLIQSVPYVSAIILLGIEAYSARQKAPQTVDLGKKV